MEVSLYFLLNSVICLTLLRAKIAKNCELFQKKHIFLQSACNISPFLTVLAHQERDILGMVILVAHNDIKYHSRDDEGREPDAR